MKSFLVVSVLSLISLSAFAENTKVDLASSDLQDFENKILSCSQIGTDINDPLFLKCYTNGHNLLKSKINSQINKLPNRDKITLLNTKGLDFEIVRYSCKKNHTSNLAIKECEVYTDLAYYDYIISRYYQP